MANPGCSTGRGQHYLWPSVMALVMANTSYGTGRGHHYLLPSVAMRPRPSSSQAPPEKLVLALEQSWALKKNVGPGVELV